LKKNNREFNNLEESNRGTSKKIQTRKINIAMKILTQQAQMLLKALPHKTSQPGFREFNKRR
jgi:hypothetical protein